MAFTQRTYAQILNAILTDWTAQKPSADQSTGTLVYISSAVLAAAIWGMEKMVSWLVKQIFPATSEGQFLDKHAFEVGIDRTAGETDAALYARIYAQETQPPAGGNCNDYEQWALSIDNVASATCVPIPRGEGTVDVIITANEANTGNESPSEHADVDLPTGTVTYDHTGTTTSTVANKLPDTGATFSSGLRPVRIGDRVENSTDGTEAYVTAIDSDILLSLDDDIFISGESYNVVPLTIEVWEYVETVRPVTAKDFLCVAPTFTTQNVVVATVGTGTNKTQAATDIESYLNSLDPGETLYQSQIQAICINNGADSATVTTPATDVVSSTYEIIRPGTVTVS